MSEPNTPVPQAQAKRLIIDTDIGVDDAAAIAWLFSRDKVPIEVHGIMALPPLPAIHRSKMQPTIP